MAGPAWLGWVLTTAFLGIAGYGVARLVIAARPGTPVPAGYSGRQRAADVAHVAMAFGMAVMCSPVGGPLPPAGWQTVFAVVTAWFLGAAVLGRGRGGHLPGWHGGDWQHAVAGLAMLYMLTAVPHSAHSMSAAWTMPHAGEAALPVLGWLFVAFFAAQAVGLGMVLRRAGSGGGLLADGRVAALCQLVMAVGTGYLLLVTL
ncbi:DUF5134 domain-containing protein [Actinokineospora enzanensis]|uniref:DUF5134 domain-containing protein n=1 Tax=Actinokineospora enzanensis TaxID=155975 RepID=UPI0003665A35|nr:DUF5134 domain-containing protein [Actinokineospora enzanensis]